MTQLGLFDREKYPNRPGYKARYTSKDAGEVISGRARTLRAAALAMLGKSRSLTADEIAEILSESVLAIRPRISELAALGNIRDTGLRRPNKSGRKAIVWAAVQRETLTELNESS